MNDLLTPEALAYIIGRVLENARIAAAEYTESPSEFLSGRKLAYYEILDTIKNELTVRDADLCRYGLDFSLEILL